MEITEADEPSRLEIALQFIKPFKSSSTTTFMLDERDGGTHVTWRMVGPKTFMTRVMGVFMSMDKMVGRDFEKGLAQLGEAATEAVSDQAGARGRARRARPRGRRGRRAACACRGDRSTRRS